VARTPPTRSADTAAAVPDGTDSCFTNTFYFYGAAEGISVLLVDDEVDSDSTVTNAVTALRGRGVTILDVGSAVEALHGGCSAGRERLQAWA
jgi:phosphoribosylpyrophosphate synthetase